MNICTAGSRSVLGYLYNRNLGVTYINLFNVIVIWLYVLLVNAVKILSKWKCSEHAAKAKIRFINSFSDTAASVEKVPHGIFFLNFYLFLYENNVNLVLKIFV